jgi:hypothetical protein
LTTATLAAGTPVNRSDSVAAASICDICAGVSGAACRAMGARQSRAAASFIVIFSNKSPRKRKVFFFEKKKQKTLQMCVRGIGPRAPIGNSLFASFSSEKEDSSLS